jgi:hypothetical protein
MNDERKEYKCQKCKSSRWLLVKHEHCVCGGKLYPVQAAKDLMETIFEGFKGK